ncbi:MAG: 50S ribosomal protein L17 [Bacillota bacterium]|nr:50S ribosomal protein L17 [Bacillota bacterium]
MAQYRKLSRSSSHRSLMFRNLVISLIEHERIETTVTRAKEARKFADKMISLGKRGDLHARRQAESFLCNKTACKKLFDEIAPRYKERNGGYTRIVKIGPRKGDAAEMAVFELVK